MDVTMPICDRCGALHDEAAFCRCVPEAEVAAWYADIGGRIDEAFVALGSAVEAAKTSC